MRNTLISIVLFSITMMAGCATNYQDIQSEQYAGAVKSETSEFDDKIKIEGPTLRTTHTVSLLDMYHNAFLIRGWKDKQTGEALGHQIYVRIRYASGSWAFFQSASFEGGKQAEVSRISSDVSSCTAGCTYTEVVGVEITSALLEQHRTNGLRLRINAKSGAHSIIEFPANYIQGYLDAYNQPS